MASQTIVVVEDEPDILEVLSYNLRRSGFNVSSAQDGAKGLELVRQSAPDLVVLDLMLPSMDGLDVCRFLKKDDQTRHIPVIMLTARSEESDIVLGLGVGADDYIAKPFSPHEFIARVKAVLRRSPVNSEAKQFIIFKGLQINKESHKAKLNGVELIFTSSEFRLIAHLASNPGRVFTREQLMNRSLGDDSIVIDRNIDVHIRSIRKKLGESASFIETVRGVGYRFKESGPMAVQASDSAP